MVHRESVGRKEGRVHSEYGAASKGGQSNEVTKGPDVPRVSAGALERPAVGTLLFTRSLLAGEGARDMGPLSRTNLNRSRPRSHTTIIRPLKDD